MTVITRDRRTRRDMYRLIRNLPPEDVEKVASYAAFLTYQRISGSPRSAGTNRPFLFETSSRR